ncbi:MAG: hypothetical protein ACRD5Z_19935, partial [Bryobacteraceae bacterium]
GGKSFCIPPYYVTLQAVTVGRFSLIALRTALSAARYWAPLEAVMWATTALDCVADKPYAPRRRSPSLTTMLDCDLRLIILPLYRGAKEKRLEFTVDTFFGDA